MCCKIAKEPLLDRLSDAVMALNLDSDLAHEIMEQVHKPQNALMHQKMQERLAAGAGMAVSVIFWVTFLLVKLWVEKDRYEISLKKALGFTAMEIKKTYFAKFTVITILAALAGIVSGHYLGQSLLGIILRSMGAAGFRFLISGKIVYIAIPLLVFIAAIGAMLPGIGGIGKIKPYECCMERE